MIDMPADRLDPERLRSDAVHLLGQTQDAVTLVASLLKEVRQNFDTQEAIRKGYGSSYRLLDEMHREACDERNSYREALRLVKRATRNVRVGRW